jgi:hypothetical protein
MRLMKRLLYYSLLVPVMAFFWIIAAAILIPMAIIFGFVRFMEHLSDS